MLTENCIIMKSTAGFYYVRTPSGETVECRARGVFRKEKISPLVGDRVTIDASGGKGTVTDILERKNFLVRPPVANIDKLVIISSVVQPQPNLFIIDRLTALAEDKGIEPVVVFSKCDLADASDYVDIYLSSGIASFAVSSKTGEGADSFARIFESSVCALTGNSGVGKSSALNMIEPSLRIATADISDKLGRGRHTTRTVELYEICGGFIADTPGFSSLDFENGERIVKENLQFCFPEFEKYIGSCKFVSCAHTGEKGCAVGDAAERGEIQKSRLDSYRMMYGEVKDFKDWMAR